MFLHNQFVVFFLIAGEQSIWRTPYLKHLRSVWNCFFGLLILKLINTSVILLVMQAVVPGNQWPWEFLGWLNKWAFPSVKWQRSKPEAVIVTPAGVWLANPSHFHSQIPAVILHSNALINTMCGTGGPVQLTLFHWPVSLTHTCACTHTPLLSQIAFSLKGPFCFLVLL